MKFRAHRGLCHYYPENTMPAFVAALEQGYEQVETGPRPTKDGILVLMHLCLSPTGLKCEMFWEDI